MWAVAKLGLSPDPHWTASVLGEAYAKLSMFKPQELSNTLWALATLRSAPGPFWLQRAEAVATEQMAEWRAQNLSACLWAFAVLGHRPGPEFAEALWRRTDAELARGAMTPQVGGRRQGVCVCGGGGCACCGWQIGEEVRWLRHSWGRYVAVPLADVQPPLQGRRAETWPHLL